MASLVGLGRSGEVHSGLGTDKLVIDCNQYTLDIQETDIKIPLML